jgi:hypothetical protein
MQCPLCGQQNRPDARFCDRCRAPLSPGSPANTVPPPSQFNTPNTGPGGPGWQSPTTINQALPKSKSSGSAGSSPISITPSLQRGRHGGVVGVARNIQLRSQQSGFDKFQRTTQILSFRLEQYDRIGNRVRVVPVEMRGQNIIGFITDGDRVEVFGKEKDGLLRADAIENLSQGALVEARRYPHPLLIPLVAILVVVLFFCILSTSNSNQQNYQASGNPDASNTASQSDVNTVSPSQVLSNYCRDLQAHVFQDAYDQYSTSLKSKVSSGQLAQTWSQKGIDSCTYDTVQVSGNQATTTLYIHEFETGQTDTYHVILVQDSSNGWKIDSIELQ